MVDHVKVTKEHFIIALIIYSIDLIYKFFVLGFLKEVEQYELSERNEIMQEIIHAVTIVSMVIVFIYLIRTAYLLYKK